MQAIAEARPFKTLQEVREDPPSPWEPTEEQQKRRKRIEKRVNDMLTARFPYELSMKQGLLAYEGKWRKNPDDPRDEVVITPSPFIYVEAKTAEEVKTSQSYEFQPVEDAGDSWKVDLLDAARQQAESKTQFGETFIEWHRQKNIFGVGIVRTGYRCIQGKQFQRIPDPDSGIAEEWEEVTVEKYNDLFFDIVSPFDFGIDPNSTSLNDAEDCFHLQRINWNVFQERYATNEMYTDCDKVRPGIWDRTESAPSKGLSIDGEQVLIYEYFNKITDEWVTYANNVEIRADHLPDDHKQLPFAAIHNHPQFLTEYLSEPSLIASSSLRDAAPSYSFNTTTSFWTRGDPSLIRDLALLRTDFGRAAVRNAKLAGEVIVATAPGKKFDSNKNWRGGDQAVGMMGQFQAVPLGQPMGSNFQFMFDVLDQIMTMCVGVDPRVLGDPKQKTAEEAAIQRETGMMRLMMGIRKNQAGGITRLGKLTAKNIQQYYTIPTLKRLTGNEDIKQFDEVTKDPRTGKPLYGKTYRRISSESKYTERVSRHTKNPKKYSLHLDDAGVNSFLARPDYIRTSEVDIRVQGGTEAGEIRAVNRAQLMNALQTASSLLPFVQAGLLKLEDLPNIKEISRRINDTFNLPKADTEKPDAADETAQLMKQYLATSQPFSGKAYAPSVSPQGQTQPTI